MYYNHDNLPFPNYRWDYQPVVPIDPDLKVWNLSSSSVPEWVPSVMCLNINRGILHWWLKKIKNGVNRLAGKSWLLLEKDSGEGELRDLEVTTSPWCEFSPPHDLTTPRSHHLTMIWVHNAYHEVTISPSHHLIMMWVHNAYHKSKKDCSSVQEVKEVVHQERVLLPTNN